jgi:hypothetical protein
MIPRDTPSLPTGSWLLRRRDAGFTPSFGLKHDYYG